MAARPANGTYAVLPKDCDLFEAGYNYFLTKKWDIGCDPSIIAEFSGQILKVMSCYEIREKQCGPVQEDTCVTVITVTPLSYSFVYPDNNEGCQTIIGEDGAPIERRAHITTPLVNVEPCQE
jgi:hypothetical protein